jgi:transposase-like protein
VIGILKQHEAGVKSADVCREHGISAATFYGWKSKADGKTPKVSFGSALTKSIYIARRLRTQIGEKRDFAHAALSERATPCSHSWSMRLPISSNSAWSVI